MSEVKLNLIDSQQVFHGTIHGSVVDACVAALSAEPETIAELSSALTRYIKPLDDRSPFATFHSSVHSSVSSSVSTPLDTKPWDAGIVVIDLAARIVASESTYSMPHPSGEVRYHDGTISTDVAVMYRVPDDWSFVSSIDEYKAMRVRKNLARAANPQIDYRQVLYGRALSEFIAGNIQQVSIEQHAPESVDQSLLLDRLEVEISAIQARWLTTPREDLGGSSPRDVMLARQDFIDFDLHTRELQWSFQGEGPPCLAKDSHAYKFAGFGTHEWVIYYDLVRHLLSSALEIVRQTEVCRIHSSPEWELSVPQAHDETARGAAPVMEYDKSTPARKRLTIKDNTESNIDGITCLEQLKTAWLEQPQRDLEGRIPAIIIENERKRLPLALRPRDMIVDEDCPMCQMFGDETTPLGMGVGFWHLDGSHMDDDFAFSSYKTRLEWEAENRRREEFDKEFNRRWEERQQRIARGEALEPDPFFDPDPFQDLEFDDSICVSDESIDDDEKEFPQ